MNLTDKIYIAGHRGLMGSSIHRLLISKGYSNILTRRSTELDLRNQQAVSDFFEKEKPGYVFVAAAKVGGILANNNYPADFIYENLCIQNNIIHSAYKSGVTKLLFLGSSCIYPTNAQQPIKEDYLLTGVLEPTNESYAIAKIAGIKMCQAYHRQYGCRFISAMPTNLYGPGDNYDLNNSHVLPALLRKFHEAKINNSPTVSIWGSGMPRREFLHADDAATACLFLMLQYELPDIINVGSGQDHSIKEIAEMIKQISGYTGQLVFDETKPDGTMRKLLDVSRINALGWKAAIPLEVGLKRTFEELVLNYQSFTAKETI